MISVLYVSYDGVLEPLGESQVVAYVERLARDYAITLMSFEKAADLIDRQRVAAVRRQLDQAGIEWVPRKYHKQPTAVATSYDIVMGILSARRICRRRSVRIIHSRSYVPALIALGARSASRAAFLFDMRGLWPEEKVEAGHWTRGSVLYRAAKWWERRFISTADGIVSLTEAGFLALAELGYQLRPNTCQEVIPTAVDLERFTPGPKDPILAASLGVHDSVVIGCVGTMSNWYLRHEMLRYLARLSRAVERVKVLIVTRESREALSRDAQAAGLAADRFVITQAEFQDMPRHVRLFDAGVFFIKPSLAKKGSAATKLAEFLACGVPVIINDGVGDSGAIVRASGAGLVLPDTSDGAFDASLPRVEGLLRDPDIPSRCRQVAVERFDLEQAVNGYRRMYRHLAGTGTAAPDISVDSSPKTARP